jgi:hypothetical protein
MSTLVAQTISNGTVSTSSANVIQGSAKAWVNFNGTGTVAIRASYNVSSITDNGTGQYTVNFTNAMPDVNFATTFNTNGNSDSFGGGGRQFAMVRSRTTSSVGVNAVNDGGAEEDPSYVGVAVFR